MKNSANQPAPIVVSVTVNNNIENVWKHWTLPEHITKWNFASDDWQCPKAENNPVTGGKFSTRMEAKDGSFGFDFEGTYSKVIPQKLIEYAMDDMRKVSIEFESKGEQTLVTETFDPESENPVELQKNGWQAILNNFKKHTESVK